jgi:amino acid transporter/mannitol/fructose-specific phosphotransferase system IIA component (Ntr-type)
MQLKKGLKFIDVFSIASGAMISSGIFILPGLAFRLTGPSMFVSYLLAGILALSGVLSIVELSTAMPKAGGDYFFVTRSMGPMIGTVSGFLSWFALSLKTAFAIFGISIIFQSFIKIEFGFNLASADASVLAISIIITIIFVLLNIVGVEHAGRAEVYLVVALLALMIAYVFIGMPKVQVKKFEPFTYNGLAGLLATSGFVFVSFGGLLKVASISEEVENPKKNIPLGLIASVVSISIIYALLLIVTVGVSDPSKLSGSTEPISQAARSFMGETGYVVMTIAALLAFITTANAGIMAASRYPLALSRDNLLPGFLSKVNKRLKTPIISIILTGFFIVLSLFLPLEFLAKAASTVILTTYILSNIAIIILRTSKVQNYRPSFKSPMFPWIQITGIVIFILLIIETGLISVGISLGITVIAVLIYFIYGRKQAAREYAFLHLIERITDKKLTSHNLESELREVIRQRDDVVKDVIDELIIEAPVIDFENKITSDEVFEKVSEALHKDLGLSVKKLKEYLKKRELDSSTVITPFVAIPHTVIPGTDTFKIAIVRSKEGIVFGDDNVKAAFIIIGSKDKRNLHLKALSAIAQIIQSKNFDQNWNRAKSLQNLKDVLLLSNRKRFL